MQPLGMIFSLIGRIPCHPQGSTPLTMVSSSTTETSASSMSSFAPHSASSSSSARSGETNAKYLHGIPLRSGESEYRPLEKPILPMRLAMMTMSPPMRLARFFWKIPR